MKAKIFFSVFVALIFVSFVGCGLDVPNTTKQIELSGKTDLSVGAQVVSATYTVNTYDGKVASSQGTNYSVDSKTPYIWTLSYWDGSSWRRVFQIEADTSLALTFYLPATYLLRVEAPTSFYTGMVENTTIPTQDELTIVVSQGSGYKASNFLPGQIVSTPFSSYFLRTEIVEIWGTGTYSPPPVNNDPVDPGNNDPGRAGNALVSFDAVKGQKNGNIVATLSVEGLLDNLSVSGVYYDKTLLTLKSVSAISGSGWSITTPGVEIGFVAKNNNPQPGKVASFQVVFQAKNTAGITGITWGPASYTGTYKGEKIALMGVDGIVRVE